MDIKANYHTHTTFCDGTSTPREIVEQALRLGMGHLGFSGHMDADIHMNFDEYVKEIRLIEKEKRNTIDVLCGVELDTLYNPQYAYEVDFVIGSTHFMDVEYARPLSIDDTPEDVVTLCNEFYGGDFYRLCKAYFELEATVVDRFPCTIIGHFDLVSKFNKSFHFFDEEDPKYLNPALEAMEYIAHKGVPFEINTRLANRKILFPDKRFLKYLYDLGGEIVLSSDAHHLKELLDGFDYATTIAKECGFNHTNYLIKNNGKITFCTQPL